MCKVYTDVGGLKLYTKYLQYHFDSLKNDFNCWLIRLAQSLFWQNELSLGNVRLANLLV